MSTVKSFSFLRRLQRSLHALTLRLVGNFFAGHVTRATLLTRLLPLSLATFVTTMIIGILLFPGDYDWRRHVLSRVISPRYNPDAYWLPSIGIAAAALLTLPFAGYVERRLRAIAPGVARSAGVAFALGLLLLASVGVPLAGFGRLHENLARAAAGVLAVGMLCCGVCALRDHLRFLGGRRSLCDRLSFCWAALPLLPITAGAVSGVMLLGRQAGHGWALRTAEVLRSTMFWQLAFWEWVGLGLLFGFFFLSVLWLPEQANSPAPSFAPVNPEARRHRSLITE